MAICLYLGLVLLRSACSTRINTNHASNVKANLHLGNHYMTETTEAYHVQKDHYMTETTEAYHVQNVTRSETANAFHLSNLQETIMQMSSSAAFMLAFASMAFWGSWANTLLVAQVRFELFFLNYMLGNAAAVLVMASVSSPNVVHLFTGHGIAVVLSVVAGIFYASGTIAMTKAIATAGMSLAVPIVMGMEFSLGVPLMLFVEGFGNPAHWRLSFAGIAAVLCAMALDTVAHERLKQEQDDNTYNDEDDMPIERGKTEPINIRPKVSFQRQKSEPSKNSSTRIAMTRTHNMDLVELRVPKGRLFRHVCSLHVHDKNNEPQPQRKVDSKTHANHPRLGLLLSVFAGLAFSFWPCLASIVEGHGIGLFRIPNAFAFSTFYTVFIGSALIWAVCMLPILGRHPIDNAEEINFWNEYVKQPVSIHGLGVLGGLLQGLGTVLSLQSGEVLGNAVSMSITRCSPVVAALWGWLYWSELQGASVATRVIFFAMIFFFLVAVALLGWASAV